VHTVDAEADAVSFKHIERTAEMVDHCAWGRVAAAFPFAERAGRETRTGGDVFNRQASKRAACAELASRDSHCEHGNDFERGGNYAKENKDSSSHVLPKTNFGKIGDPKT
jgi:hypothetical protein